MQNRNDNAPLQQLDEWDDFVATRYRQGKSEEARKILEALPQETLAQPNISLYYAAVLMAEHDSASALKFARIAVTSKDMLPQEESIAKRILIAAEPAH